MGAVRISRVRFKAAFVRALLFAPLETTRAVAALIRSGMAAPREVQPYALDAQGQTLLTTGPRPSATRH